MINLILKHFYKDKIYIARIFFIVNVLENIDSSKSYIIVIMRKASVKDIIFRAKKIYKFQIIVESSSYNRYLRSLFLALEDILFYNIKSTL